MAARTVVQSIAGASLALSASIPSTYDAAGYTDTDVIATWTAIGEVENFGNHGVTANIAEFTPVQTSVVTKIKGSKNYGTMNMTVGSIPNSSRMLMTPRPRSSM